MYSKYNNNYEIENPMPLENLWVDQFWYYYNLMWSKISMYESC